MKCKNSFQANLAKFGAVSLVFIAPSVVFASSGETDIVYRVINFVIFFGLLYYFAGSKIKGIFVARREGIASALAKIQDKLQESKKSKQRATLRVDEARKTAKEIIESAHKEGEIIAKRIEESAKNEMDNLVRQFEEELNFERRKVEKAVISEILDELLKKQTLNKDILSSALLKKVA